jgi:hypothetical protein
MTWLFEPLCRLWCGLRGHHTVMHFENDRLSLRCLSCSYETNGWALQHGASNTPSVSHKSSPEHGRTIAHPLGISREHGGARFADRSPHADNEAAVRGPQAIGDRPRSRTMRLAS